MAARPPSRAKSAPALVPLPVTEWVVIGESLGGWIHAGLLAQIGFKTRVIAEESSDGRSDAASYPWVQFGLGEGELLRRTLLKLGISSREIQSLLSDDSYLFELGAPGVRLRIGGTSQSKTEWIQEFFREITRSKDWKPALDQMEEAFTGINSYWNHLPERLTVDRDKEGRLRVRSAEWANHLRSIGRLGGPKLKLKVGVHRFLNLFEEDELSRQVFFNLTSSSRNRFESGRSGGAVQAEALSFLSGARKIQSGYDGLLALVKQQALKLGVHYQTVAQAEDESHSLASARGITRAWHSEKASSVLRMKFKTQPPLHHFPDLFYSFGNRSPSIEFRLKPDRVSGIASVLAEEEGACSAGFILRFKRHVADLLLLDLSQIEFFDFSFEWVHHRVGSGISSYIVIPGNTERRALSVGPQSYPELGSLGEVVAALEATASVAHRAGVRGPFGDQID